MNFSRVLLLFLGLLIPVSSFFSGGLFSAVKRSPKLPEGLLQAKIKIRRADNTDNDLEKKIEGLAPKAAEDTFVATVKDMESAFKPLTQESTGFFKRLFHSYNQNLLNHPYITKVISSAVVGGLGDLLMQLWVPYIQGKSVIQLDLRRLTVFATVSGLYFAPVIHVWFNWLNSLQSYLPENASNAKRALMMISIDQTVGNVLVNGGFFYAFELVRSCV
jgi:hypothetical protein